MPKTTEFRIEGNLGTSIEVGVTDASTVRLKLVDGKTSVVVSLRSDVAQVLSGALKTAAFEAGD